MRVRSRLCLVIVQDGLDVVALWVVDKACVIAGMVVARAGRAVVRATVKRSVIEALNVLGRLYAPRDMQGSGLSTLGQRLDPYVVAGFIVD